MLTEDQFVTRKTSPWTRRQEKKERPKLHTQVIEALKGECRRRSFFFFAFSPARLYLGKAHVLFQISRLSKCLTGFPGSVGSPHPLSDGASLGYVRLFGSSLSVGGWWLPGLGGRSVGLEP